MFTGHTFSAPANRRPAVSRARINYFIFEIAALWTAHNSRLAGATTTDLFGLIGFPVVVYDNNDTQAQSSRARDAARE